MMLPEHPAEVGHDPVSQLHGLGKLVGPRKVTARLASHTSASGCCGPSLRCSRAAVAGSRASALASFPASCRQSARLVAQDRANGWSSPSRPRSACSVRSPRATASSTASEPTDLGWAARADTLNASLVPSGLDPDPLAIVEQ